MKPVVESNNSSTDNQPSALFRNEVSRSAYFTASAEKSAAYRQFAVVDRRRSSCESAVIIAPP